MIAWITGKLHRFFHRGKPVKCFRVQVLAITFFPIKPYIMWWSLISGLNTPHFLNNSGFLVRMTSIRVDELFVGSGYKPVSSKRRRILLHINSDLSRKSELLFKRNRAWGYHHQNEEYCSNKGTKHRKVVCSSLFQRYVNHVTLISVMIVLRTSLEYFLT